LIIKIRKDPKEITMSIGWMCDLLDDTGNIISGRAICVNGNSQRKITVLMCRDENIPAPHKSFKAGDKVKLSLEFYQMRGLGRQSGLRVKTSNIFEIPDKFAKESHTSFGFCISSE
jgi:hypothetical protein